MAIQFLNSQNIAGGITTSASSDMAGLNMTADIAMSTNNITLADSAQIQLGNLSGGDMKLYYVSGIGGYVLNKSEDLRIINQSDNGDIIFETDNGSGSTAVYFFLDGGQSETDDLITNWPDNSKATFGNSRDLEIYHDGSNSYINETGTGSLYIKSAGAIRLQSDTGENMIYAVNDGAVNLYHNNAVKLATTSAGVSVTGTQTISTIDEVGSDTDKFLMSDSGEVKYVTGANLLSYIGAGTGSGNVSNTGTPANNQVAIWTNATTIEGDADLTFDGTDLTLGSGVINMPNNKAVSWANSSVRGEGNILKLTATTTIQNQQNTQIYFDGGDAAISLDIHNAGTATGDDAKITFETQGAMDYAIGIDKSDSNKFKISRSDALETNTVISLDGNSDVLFASDIEASGVYVGATNTSYDLYNNGTTYLNGNVTVDAALTVSGGAISISGDGSNATVMTESGSGDFEINTVADMVLDAGGGDIILRDDGTEYGRLTNSSQDFIIKNTTANKDIIFQTDDGSGSDVATYFFLDGATSETGELITTFPDDSVLTFGDGRDLKIWHDATHSYIRDAGTGSLIIRATDFQLNNSANSANMITGTDGGAVTLYCNGAVKAATASSGFSVTGKQTISTIDEVGSDTDKFLMSDSGEVKYVTGANLASYIGATTGGPYLALSGGTMTGDVTYNDDVKIKMGTGGGNSDIYHNGTDMYIRNLTAAGDLSFAADSTGSGGSSTTYFALDGGTVLTRFYKGVNFNDDVKLTFGNITTPGDLEIFHDEDNSYIKETGTGNLYIQASERIRFTGINGEALLYLNENDNVELYYNNVKTLETTSTGVSVTGTQTISTIDEIGSDTDKFLMADSGEVKYVTGANLRSYIGAGTGSGTVTSVTFSEGSGNKAGITLGGSTTWTTSGTLDIGIDIQGQTALGATAAGGDYLLIYDTSGLTNKKVSVTNLVAAAPQGDITAVTASTNNSYLGINVANSSGPIPDVGINLSGLTALATPADEDVLLIYDEGVPQNKKITVSNLIAAAPQGDITAVVAGTGMSGGGTSGSVTLNCSITNNNQLTNGSGYTTNTGTTTASNSQTFTNKSGNISQWTNDSGYTTNSGTVTGTGASNRIAIWNSSTGLTSDSDLEWNSTSNKLIFESDYSISDNSGVFELNHDQSDITTSILGFGGSGALTVGENTVYTAASGFYVPSGYGISAGTTATASGTIRATGNIIAYYSDERLKDFEGTITNALDKVCQLNGYYYKQNKKATELGFDNEERQVGVSAQEVEKIMPEVIETAPISYNTDEDYLTVDYGKLVPLLIESIKELKQEIEILKNK